MTEFPKRLSRQELYDQVWDRPVTKVARDYAISDVALRKICRKHRIPLPGRGYWAKLAAGKSVRRVALRHVSDPAIDEITIHGGADLRLSENLRHARDAAKDLESAPERRIAVADSSKPSHRLACAVDVALRRRKPGEDALVRISGKGLIPVAVSVALMTRTVQLIDALCVALEERGCVFKLDAAPAMIVVGGDEVGFSIVEQDERWSRSPTPGERHANERRRRWDPSFKEPEYIERAPNGRLRLQLQERHLRGLRKSWGDGKTQRLEDLLNEVVAGVFAYAAGLRERREQRERWHREWEEAERRREEAERLARRETARREMATRLCSLRTELSQLATLEQMLGEPEDDDPAAHPRIAEFRGWCRDRRKTLSVALSADAIENALQDAQIFGPEADEHDFW